MATYLVRLQESNELVGIFWADNLKALGWLIDEAVDPFICEYKKLPYGGIFWPNPIDVTIPLDDSCFSADEDDDNFDPDPVGDALKIAGVPSLSGDLYDDLFSNKGWKKYEIDEKEFYG